MKQTVRVAGLMALLSALALQAQTPEPKPGPEHQKLNIWLGDWTYEADVQATPLGPAGKYLGKMSVRPILGGFFVQFRAEEKGPTGPYNWYEIDAYDALNKRYTWFNCGSDGSVTTVTYTIDGTTVPYSGTLLKGDKQYKLRGTITFGADFKTMTDKCEYSEDGQKWMPRYQSKGVRTKQSPQKIETAK